MRDFQPELRIYTNEDDMPSAYVHQIRSFGRLKWGDAYLYYAEPRLSPPSWNTVHFVLVEDDCLYSAARVIERPLEFLGEKIMVYGIGGVLTYPAFERRGFGAQVVRAASDYIRGQSDADLGLLWTYNHLIEFYGRFGWESVPESVFHCGDPLDPESTDHEPMMLFVSDQAQGFRQELKSYPLYVGKRSW